MNTNRRAAATIRRHDDEEWRPIPGWDGYEASTLGRVRGVDRVITRSDGHTQTIRGTFMRQFLDTSGRPSVYLRSASRGTRTTFRVHRLVLEAFVGPRPEGMECCHGDGNELNNRLDNLRWDTKSSNAFDRVRHGTHSWAARTHCSVGHPLSGDNLRITVVKGYRVRSCRECVRRRDREAKRARTATRRAAA